MASGVLAGCAEELQIHTHPPGSSVEIDQQAIGTTPVTYSVPTHELRDSIHYRIEPEGYLPDPQ